MRASHVPKLLHYSSLRRSLSYRPYPRKERKKEKERKIFKKLISKKTTKGSMCFRRGPKNGGHVQAASTCTRVRVLDKMLVSMSHICICSRLPPPSARLCCYLHSHLHSHYNSQSSSTRVHNCKVLTLCSLTLFLSWQTRSTSTALPPTLFTTLVSPFHFLSHSVPFFYRRDSSQQYHTLIP